MIGAILKLSYNHVGDSSLTGGICGSCFCVKSDLALTANHILSRDVFKPNEGFINCQFWLLLPSNAALELKPDDLVEYGEIDLTMVKLPRLFAKKHYLISDDHPIAGAKCYNNGYKGNEMPAIDAEWKQDGLTINSFSLDNNYIKAEGKIKSLKKLTVSALDVKIENVYGIETSYGGILGMSGGPLIDTITGKVIGLMSIGLPENKPQKDTLFAISALELIKRTTKLY